jgi:hypothetical protein
MAVSVDTVYKTVLLILNKEQRGYMTPDEFNKIGTQAQLEVYLKYFEDLNQLLRVPQVDLDYADRIALLDEKISLFKRNQSLGEPTSNGYSLPTDLQELGTVIYNNNEMQRVQRNDFYNLYKSNLTKPSETYPIYLYENSLVNVYPETITSGVSVNYLKFPSSVIWGFTVDANLGNYKYNSTQYNSISNPTGSINFELHQSEQVELILRILEYAGIVIRDPQVIQIAAQKVQQDNMNEKQ